MLDVDDTAKDAVGEIPPTPGVELLKQLKEAAKAGDEKNAGKADVGEDDKPSDDVTTENKAEMQQDVGEAKKEQAPVGKVGEKAT